MATRRSRSSRGLAASDEAVVDMMAKLEAMQARIAEAKARRIDVVGESALACFPEIDAGEYGDDIDEFFRGMREDALRWRELQSTGARKASSAPAGAGDKGSVSDADESDGLFDEAGDL